MKKAVAVCFVIAFTGIIKPAGAYCQANLETLKQENEHLNRKIVALEKQLALLENRYQKDVENMEKYYENYALLLENKLKNATERYANEQSALTTSFNSTMNVARHRLDQHSRNFDYIFASGLFGIIAAVFGVWRFIKKETKSKIEEIFPEEFERHFLKKKEEIFRAVKQINNDLVLKENSSILVLTPEGADDSFIKKFFKTQGFKNVHPRKFDMNRKDEFHDIVFINNEDNLIDGKEIVAYMKAKTPKETVLFNFGKNVDPIFQESNKNLYRRFASSNFRSQIHGNLMNALRHQEILAEMKTIDTPIS